MNAQLAARKIQLWFQWQSDHPLWYLSTGLLQEGSDEYYRILGLSEDAS